VGAMSWAQNWLGFADGETASTPSGRVALDKARFGYSAELIDGLKDDHADLVRRYGEIEQLALKGTYGAIPMALAGFKNKLDVHLLHENLQFYCYLEQRLARRADSLALIKEFRGEMNAIARAVVNFVKKYRAEGVSAANSQAFLAELREMGALLAQRVEREEKDLYTLYRP
jgi:regulator of sigma D